MAIFSAPKTFHPDTWLPKELAFPQDNHALLVYTFLISSAILLITFSFFSKKVSFFFQTKSCVLISGILVCIGTAIVFLSFIGLPIVFIAALCMGIGTSFQIVLFGIVFSKFDFASCVLNASGAFAIGFIGADILTNWIPSPISGIFACIMPLLSMALFLRHRISLTSETSGEIPLSYVKQYITRLAISMVFLGFVVGAMRVVCGDKLLSSGDITMELVLGVGCMVSAAVLLFAIALSKRTELWDSLFRNVTPMIMLGIAGIALLAGDAKMFAAFFSIIGFACLVSITWILLASFAKNLNGSYVFVFGLGYGIVQGASILGVAMANFFSSQGLLMATLGNAPYMEIVEFTSELGLSDLAILLMVAFSAAYATMPRYRELKEILASLMVALSHEIRAKKETKTGAKDESSKTSEKDAASAIQEQSLDGDEANTEEASTGTSSNEEGIPSIAAKEEQWDKKGSFTRRCDEISAEYKLSAREIEAFFLLAKGHNAAYLMEKLCISKSTAKTHINHIYKKLGIHTQQELLNMVEDRKRGPAPTPVGVNVDRAALQDAIRRAKEEGPLERDPSELVRHISQDIR